MNRNSSVFSGPRRIVLYRFVRGLPHSNGRQRHSSRAFPAEGSVLSVTTNIPSAQDVRILIDGKEVSALGGHISLLAPLRALAEQESAGSPKQR